jgi:hypothetical protein
MNAYDIFSELGFGTDKYGILLPGWGQSIANIPKSIDFLEEKNYHFALDYCGFDPSIESVLKQTADMVSEITSLKAFAWHVYYRLTSLPVVYGSTQRNFSGWPLPEKYLGEKAAVMYLLIALGTVSKSIEKYRQMKVPENIIKDTLSSLKRVVGFYQNINGVPGLYPTQLAWTRNYLHGRIFRIGRMEYKLAEIFPFGTVLKNRLDGRKVLLAPAGAIYNVNGFCLQCDSNPTSFTAEYHEDSNSICGYPVSPHGFTLAQQQSFCKQEWEIILKEGDIVIDMHVPCGGGMNPEVCKDSFKKAFNFFRTTYPRKFKEVIFCRSWIFNTQFEEKLPDSNLAKLMRECYLFPAVSSGMDGFFFLFGRNYDDLSEAPRDTSSRRAMLEILESGENLRLGGMLFLAEDLDEFGNSYYRSNYNLKKPH